MQKPKKPLSLLPELNLPIEPLVSLLLIGLLLTGMVLYYRSTKMQRFLEPALAALEPRTAFSTTLRGLLAKEFGPARQGIEVLGNTIRVRVELVFQGAEVGSGGPSAMARLGRVFSALLEDPALRSKVNLILVKGKSVQGLDLLSNHSLRRARQGDMDEVLDRLFGEAPELEKKYPSYFGATTLSGYLLGAETRWVEFEIIPSERVHAEVLQGLEKYAR